MNVSNDKLDWKEFEGMREEVLTMWPTGREVDLDEAVEYQKSISDKKNYTKKLRKNKGKDILIQPRSGVGLVDEYINILKYLQKMGGADLLSANSDSYTRNARFEDAQKAIDESIKRGRSTLNGIPIVNFGVETCRRIIDSVDNPVMAIGNGADLRLLAEISMASGFTGMVTSPVFSALEFCKDVHLERIIRNFQYNDRLIGFYEENGVPITKMVHTIGLQTGVFIPSLMNTNTIIDSLIAAEQGVKNIILDTAPQGNLIQDIAAFRTLPKICKEYLHKTGHKDVDLYLSVFHWAGVISEDEAQAYGTICYTTVEGILGGADVIAVKSVQEGKGLPQRKENADTCRATRQIINMLLDQHLYLENEDIEIEAEMIEIETKNILDRVLELGEGDLAIGTVRAVEAGVIDHPLSPYRYCKGDVVFIRDNDGATRVLEPGNLPFEEEVLKFHREKVAERGKTESVGYETMIKDLVAVSKGRLVGRAT